MTRIYAARRLLEHGPLTFAQLLAITRWPESSARSALTNLELTGAIAVTQAPGRNPRLRVYRLNDTARVRAFAEGAH